MGSRRAVGQNERYLMAPSGSILVDERVTMGDDTSNRRRAAAIGTVTVAVLALMAGGGITGRAIGQDDASLGGGCAGSEADVDIPDETESQAAPLRATSPPKCRPTVFHVAADRKADEKGNGSKARPYQSLEQALAAGQKRNACALEIFVAAGRYEGALSITRPTTVEGTSMLDVIVSGTITNRDTELVLRNLLVTSFESYGPAKCEHSAALRAYGSRNFTLLEHVEINSPKGYGVYQDRGGMVLEDVAVHNVSGCVGDPGSGVGVFVGGGAWAEVSHLQVHGSKSRGVVVMGPGTSLAGTDVEINDTRAMGGDRESGIGIHVGGGAQVGLENVTVTASASQGLDAHGSGTSVAIENLTVTSTGRHPSQPGGPGIPAHSGAVEVREGAVFRSSLLRIQDSAFVGLLAFEEGVVYARGRGAECIVAEQVRAGGCPITVVDSRTSPSTPGANDGGGIAAAAIAGGRIELQNFEIARADLAGLMISGRSSAGAIPQLVARRGIVHHSIIGASVGRDVDVNQVVNSIIDRVVYRDNRRNLSSETLPVPRR
ncbi:MAG: right-handed parallel beta-helix repeat-containing protein [Deltaproteobacteria bacterium]|nr:right-handed parallel beta-helix repeat-containing protein [Deltaproteobacteria bacterium]